MSSDLEHLGILNALYEESCREVFGTLNGSFERVESAYSELSPYSAHIQASTDDFELIIILKGPVSFLKETYPLMQTNSEIGEGQLLDWISELANMFMGNMKNKLLSYQHTLSMGVPKNEVCVDEVSRIQRDYEIFSICYGTSSSVFESSLYTKVLNNDICFVYSECLGVGNSEFDDGELELF